MVLVCAWQRLDGNEFVMTRPRPAIVVLVVSALTLIAVPVVAVGTSSSTEVESVGARPKAVTMVRYEPGAPTFEFERITPATVTEQPAPVRLQIPRLRIDADIVPTGVAADGQAEVPEDVMTVGWYRFGQRPGDGAGSTVLIAHRDGRTEGRGVFFGLEVLQVGDPITVRDARGVEHAYRVTSREAIDKEILPTEELFTTVGEPMLVLISCGGIFRASDGGYQDNIVITAQPTSGKT